MPPDLTFWQQSTEKSGMDDSQTVLLTLEADDTVTGRYGEAVRPELILRCVEKTTAVTLQFGDHFMASVDDYGVVTYRLDARPAQRKDFTESTDNTVLGLWSGGDAIPFIKSLFGAKSLLVRATPFSESPIEARFNIVGTMKAVADLRKACKW